MEILIIIKLLAMTKNENETPDNLGRIIKNILSRVSEDTKKKGFQDENGLGFRREERAKEEEEEEEGGSLLGTQAPS